MIATGLDVLLRDPNRVRNRRVALIANHTSVTSDLQYSWQRLLSEGVTLRRIFSPEHGLYGVEQDQISVRDQPESPVQVVSLYGDGPASLRPPPGSLEDLDVVLFDIQDVGARYYTFVNTMAFFMESLEGRDITMIILDRPNPLGGVAVEGPLLQCGFESFVGVFPVPVRHGLTAGELALLYKAHKKLNVSLEVIKMEGWQRDMLYQDTGLPWVPPSPNMPSERTATVYPGMCLLEGTNISEGRGTTTPFELVGADFIDAAGLSMALNALDLPSVRFRPMVFRPTFHKYANRSIGGVFSHVTDPNHYKAFLTGIALVKTIRDLVPDSFAFRTEVYEFERERLAFDLLCGGSSIRRDLEQGKTLDGIAAGWSSDETWFEEEKRAFHLY